MGDLGLGNLIGIPVIFLEVVLDFASNSVDIVV